MPYPLALNDIVQLNIVYAQVNVVRQMNTFHFRFSGGPIPADGRAAITTFITDWSAPSRASGWVNRWQQLSTVSANVDQVTGQKVYPVRYGKITINTAFQGIGADDILPGFVQMPIMRRGDIGTRYAVGGVRVPGISEGLVTDGTPDPALLAILEVMATDMKTPFVDTAGRTWQPIVYRRLNPGSSVDVVQTTVGSRLSTQRTRVNFRGE